MNIEPYHVDIGDAALNDLRARLARTRWPEAETVTDWNQGVPLTYAKDVADYWANGYQWTERQARLNHFDHFRTLLDGRGAHDDESGSADPLNIHFIHAPSQHADARPLLITHGWPGSVVEFLKVIEPLRDPVAHGGSVDQAFHVVCPSLPGYGFSDKPQATGWGVPRIAQAWDDLMVRLGYERYFAQGGDWGSAVTTAIGIANLGHCAGIHVNMANARAPKSALANPGAEDKKALAGAKFYQDWDAGYSKQQSTRPQTLGYGLVDSPVGQMSWILEKFYAWTDCDGHPENALSRDEMLDNIMLYWLNGNGASSARLYWESFNQSFGRGGDNTVKIPSGYSLFPKEIVPIPKHWAETRYEHLVYFNEVEKGGHFAAFEQPELFVRELRDCFAQMTL